MLGGVAEVFGGVVKTLGGFVFNFSYSLEVCCFNPKVGNFRRLKQKSSTVGTVELFCFSFEKHYGRVVQSVKPPLPL